MGCIPSKHTAAQLEDGASNASQPSPRRLARKWKDSHDQRRRGPPSPVVEEDAPPWMRPHALLTEKDGQMVIIPADER